MSPKQREPTREQKSDKSYGLIITKCSTVHLRGYECLIGPNSFFHCFAVEKYIYNEMCSVLRKNDDITTLISE